MNQNVQEKGVPSMELAPKFSDYVSSLRTDLKKTKSLIDVIQNNTAPFGAPRYDVLHQKKVDIENMLTILDGIVIDMGTDFIMKHEKGVSRDDVLVRLVDSQMKKGTEYTVVRANILSRPLAEIVSTLNKQTEDLEAEYNAFSQADRTLGIRGAPTEAEELGNVLKLRDKIKSDIELFQVNK